MLAWAFARWIGLSPIREIDVTAEAAAIGALATLPMLAGLWWTLTSRWAPVRRLVTVVVEELGPHLAGRPAVQLALLAALAGMAEEILFRGVVQGGLLRLVSPSWALVVASALFGLAHFVSLTYAVLAGLMGLYLGGLFLLQDNLMVPIVAHALYDFVALMHISLRSRSLASST